LIELAVISSIEKIVGEDPLNQLQSGAAAMDKCGNLGKIKNEFLHCNFFMVFIQRAWMNATLQQLSLTALKTKSPK
jgi:hypothetical protein